MADKWQRRRERKKGKYWKKSVASERRKGYREWNFWLRRSNPANVGIWKNLFRMFD